MYQLVHADAFDVLCDVPSKSIDLVATDPPYESLEDHRARGTTTRLDNWFSTISNDLLAAAFIEFYRVLKDDTHCYVFCDPETAFLVKPMGEAAGFKFWKPLIWDKVNIGMGYHYRSRYEMVMFFEKGKRMVADRGMADLFPGKRITGGYPTQKPVEVCSRLVKQSTAPGELVLDPFMGSGSVGLAAVLAGCHFLGCDLSADAVAITDSRLTNNGATSRLIFPKLSIDATVASLPHERQST